MNLRNYIRSGSSNAAARKLMQGLKGLARERLRTDYGKKIRAFGHITATLAFAMVAACSDKGSTTTQVTPAVIVAVGTPGSVASAGVPATIPVSIQRIGSFSGDVVLTAEGLPTGATAVFAPATLGAGVTNSVLTITLGATAVQSSSTITVRATGTGVTAATTTVAFTANVPSNPSIGLAAGSSTVSIPQGQTGTVALTLDRQGGFAGIVTVAAEALPTGVTATFNPPNFGAGITATTLTLNVGTAAVAGVTNVIVRASGTGVAEKIATIQLTITSNAAPDFTLTATPAALTVAPGAGGTSVINLARTGGFAGNVTFTTSTLPAGVTATFAPNPATANSSTLTFATTAATVAGTYNITVTGAATGQTSRTVSIALTVSALPSVSIALSSTSATVVAGASTPTTVTLTRNSGLTGDLTMTAESLPTGVTVAFAPASPVSGNTTTATISTTAAVAAGVYTINIRTTGTGGVTAAAPFTLTVTAAAVQAFTVAFTSGSASIAAGGTGTLTANITRTGGFAGTVNFAVTGLPAGITATVSPAAATGATATVNLTVAAGTAAGTYNGSLNGTATGLTSSATAFSVVVTGGGGGGGGGIVQWTFCDASRIPLFFAFRDGTSGAWTRVAATGSGNTFQFALGQSVGSVAYVLPSGNGFATAVFLQTASELQLTANSECTSNPIPGTKAYTGSVAGLATPSGTSSQSATVVIGNSSASPTFAIPTFTINKILPGSQDLVATRSTLVFSPSVSSTVDAVIIRRALNQADGSAITPVLNFAAGGDAFAPATAALTVNNGGSETVQSISQFISSNGTTATLGIPLGVANTIYGIPSVNLVTGDLHRLTVSASATPDASSTTSRSAILYFRDVAAKSVTLGPVLTTPTITTSVGTVLRPRLQGTFQSEYQTGFGGGFTQTASNRSITFSATRGYFSGSTYDFDTPDLTGVTGYQTTWGLTVGTGTTYSASATNASSGIFTDGSSLLFTSRTGPVTPVSLRANALRR